MEIRENKRSGERTILLNDEDIRPVLFEYFEMGEPRLRFFEELVIGKSRADALLVQNDITGFEIKSDMDSFLRLPKQVKNYDRFCNKAYLVVGERHAKSAAEHIPDFWGIYQVGAHFKDDQIEYVITCLREAKENPRIYLKTQMRLLWRSELIRIVKRNELGGVTRKNKRELVALIIDKLGKDRALEELCNELIDRDYTIFETPKKQETKKAASQKTKESTQKSRKNAALKTARKSKKKIAKENAQEADKKVAKETTVEIEEKSIKEISEKSTVKKPRAVLKRKVPTPPSIIKKG